MPRVPVGSQSLTQEAIHLVEQEATRYSTYAEKNFNKTKVLSNIDASLLLRPSFCLPAQMLNSKSMRYFLGDRVAVVSDLGPIPFGSQGTIISIRGDVADIILDKEYIGGTSLNKWYVEYPDNFVISRLSKIVFPPC